MGIRTWDISLGNGSIAKVKAPKEEAKRLERAIRQVVDIRQHHREITGIVGGEQHSSTYWSPFGGLGTLEQPEEYAAELQALRDSLPEIITEDLFAGIKEDANKIFQKHVPVIDSRRTPEEVEQSNQKAQEFQKEREAKNLMFANTFFGSENVQIPTGQMAIVLNVTFDDSHMMTDYFHPHASIGPEMALGFVRIGPKTEAKARQILARYPELNKYTWTWHTENYSGGHGNYLQSEYTGIMWPRDAYDGRKEVNTRFEITFLGGFAHHELATYKDFPGIQGTSEKYPESSVSAGITVTENDDKDGIEIRFAEKPDTSIRDNLKANKFRWSKFSKCWYKKRSPEAIEFAYSLVANNQ